MGDPPVPPDPEIAAYLAAQGGLIPPDLLPTEPTPPATPSPPAPWWTPQVGRRRAAQTAANPPPLSPEEEYERILRSARSEYVAIDQMFTDAYQRPVLEWKLNAMIRMRFEPMALGAIVLASRAPARPRAGEYAIVDGNHRVQLARKVGMTVLFARVLDNLTYEQEAYLFRFLNYKTNVTALNLFNARLHEREPAAIDMRDIMAAMGLRVGKSLTAGDGVINAVSALDRLYDETGSRGFREVLDLIRQAWRNERRAWIGAIIDGVKQFWIRYQGEADEARLVSKLALTRPEDILRNAGVGTPARGSTGSRIGRVILETYNSGLRTRRLSDWVDYPGKGYAGRGRANPNVGGQP